ncbi:putative ABC transporter ATP-binding protein YfmM [Trichonephila clavata]|uniref:Putative ABC transporter ATP-binding protein YfmM n=1 Tax=Trichonephila clavata TaxID=2740835 RepID=A0A8X6LRR5_TRICU|nr:putative ABC transporter ATP-binding protein YfmM [Trichonephila clavata]
MKTFLLSHRKLIAWRLSRLRFVGTSQICGFFNWKRNLMLRTLPRQTILSALDEHILDFIEDILSNSPTENKYIALKSALLSRLTDSEEAKLKKLLGDCRPSDLLRQMKSLAGSKISEEFLKTLWYKRLPQQVQAILSVSKDT